MHTVDTSIRYQEAYINTCSNRYTYTYIQVDNSLGIDFTYSVQYEQGGYYNWIIRYIHACIQSIHQSHHQEAYINTCWNSHTYTYTYIQVNNSLGIDFTYLVTDEQGGDYTEMHSYMHIRHTYIHTYIHAQIDINTHTCRLTILLV